MQTSSIPQPSGKPALRSGILIGITLGVIHSVIVILIQLMNQPLQGVNLSTGSSNTPLAITTTILYLLIPLIWITGFLIIGFLGGKATGKVSTATLAGLFAGTFGGMLAAVGQIVSTALSVTNGLGPSSEGLLLFEGFAIIIYTLILTIGGGAGVGALGGVLGQNFSSVRPQPAVARPYQAAAVPVYSYMPAQPMPQPMMTPQPAFAPQPVPQPAFHVPPQAPQAPSENITPS